MTPPQVHIKVEVLFSAGMFSTRTEGEPGVHGAGVTGTHGIGVNTPRAAAGRRGDGRIRDGCAHAKGGNIADGHIIHDVRDCRDRPDKGTMRGRDEERARTVPKLQRRVAPIHTSSAMIHPPPSQRCSHWRHLGVCRALHGRRPGLGMARHIAHKRWPQGLSVSVRLTARHLSVGIVGDHLALKLIVCIPGLCLIRPASS